MMSQLAIENPFLFAKGYVLNKERGSKERKLMAGVLKTFNPEYYQQHHVLLGEADSDELKISLDDTDIDVSETEGEI